MSEELKSFSNPLSRVIYNIISRYDNKYLIKDDIYLLEVFLLKNGSGYHSKAEFSFENISKDEIKELIDKYAEKTSEYLDVFAINLKNTANSKILSTFLGTLEGELYLLMDKAKINSLATFIKESSVIQENDDYGDYFEKIPFETVDDIGNFFGRINVIISEYKAAEMRIIRKLESYGL